MTSKKEILILLCFYLGIAIPLQTNYFAFYTNVFNPIFWLFLFVFLLYWEKDKGISSPKGKREFFYGSIFSVIFIITYFYLGFFFGFSKNPYRQDWLSRIQNLGITLLPILGIERMRIFLSRHMKKTVWQGTIITLFLLLLEFPYHTLLTSILSKEAFFQYFFSTLLPLLGSSILYTYFTFRKTYVLSSTIRLWQGGTIFFFPILPNLDWFMKGFLLLLKSTLLYLWEKYRIKREKRWIYRKQKLNISLLGYAFTLSFVTILFSFMVGLFNYQPITILSNSMFPIYERGDVLIYHHTKKEELVDLPIQTIIVYQVKGRIVAHRIVEKEKKNHTVLYTTKGDNNTDTDLEKVSPEQILGTYSFSLKAIGFPSIWLREYWSKEKKEVKK